MEPYDYSKEHFGPYIWPYNEATMTREIAMNDSTRGCKNSTDKTYCATLIQMDGWEIKDDYPWQR